MKLLIPTILFVTLTSCTSITDTKKNVVSQNKINLPQMVSIPSGSFLMGCVSGKGCDRYSEKPVHRVTLKGFKLSRTEVTFDQWQACVNAGGCKRNPNPKDNGWEKGKMPVIYVTWNDAKEYTRWLSKHTGKNYRLPSEAEWEYASRAGTKTPFSTGNCITTKQANFDGNEGFLNCPKSGVWKRRNMPVASYPPNPFGLYDMHGNVSEWVEDCVHQNYHTGLHVAPNDGSAWIKGGDCSIRVRRGGSWYQQPSTLRSANRSWGTGMVSGHHAYGFRVAN